MDKILAKTLDIEPKALEIILDSFILSYQTELFSEKVKLTGKRDLSIFKENRIEIHKTDKSILYYAVIYLENNPIGNILILPINQNRTHVTIDQIINVDPIYTEAELIEFRTKLEDLKNQILLYTYNIDLENNKPTTQKKPGRKHLLDDLWAYFEINKNGRQFSDVYNEWVNRPDVLKRNLQEPERHFRKIIQLDWLKD